MQAMKYLLKDGLREIKTAAIREKRNKFVPPALIEGLPDDVRFLIGRPYHHTKNEIRLPIVVDENEITIYIDVSPLRYESIPNAYRQDDGTFLVEDPADAALRRPYPDGREWQETTVKKPVRKQKTFRSRILKAYGNQCAVCGIKEKSLLWAAHIVDVADGGKETVENGICLCINHHFAFDVGILRISSEFEVICKSSSDLGIRCPMLRLPSKESDRPSKVLLAEKMNKFKPKR